MFWQLTLIWLWLNQVKCEENTTWNVSTCPPVRNVMRAVHSDFSFTLMCDCRPERFGCDIIYIFSMNKENVPDIKINLAEGKESANETTIDGILTLGYEWMNSQDQFVEINVTLKSIENPVTVFLRGRYMYNCPDNTRIASINFTGCQNTSEFDVVPQNGKIAKYLDTGNITCSNDSRNGLAIYSNGSEAIKTQCLTNATWEDANDITCLYPINATLHVEKDDYNSTISFHYYKSANSSTGNNVTFDCSRVDRDEMIGTKKFLLNTTPLKGSSITLHPTLNGEKVSCYFENNYTRYFEEHFDTYSSTSTLNITFGPYPAKDNDSLCAFPNGSIIFYSNPLAKTSSLTLLKGQGYEEIVSHITECCDKKYGVIGQMITPSENTEIVKLTLRTNSSGQAEFYEVIPCTKKTTTATSPNDNISTETTTNPSQIITIIFACSGVLLLLIVIGVILICRKRCAKGKLKSGSDKVENVNPLYGTSDDVQTNSKSDEQVVNPLYGTAENDTEVYSVVDKKNKKGKKRKKPQGPTKGNDDVYASVDKRKGKTQGKENSGFEAEVAADATYSVVDRNKKGAQKASDSSTADLDTYAVVDRTNKKRKGAGDDDDLHGSTIQ